MIRFKGSNPNCPANKKPKQVGRVRSIYTIQQTLANPLPATPSRAAAAHTHWRGKSHLPFACSSLAEGVQKSRLIWGVPYQSKYNTGLMAGSLLTHSQSPCSSSHPTPRFDTKGIRSRVFLRSFQNPRRSNRLPADINPRPLPRSARIPTLAMMSSSASPAEGNSAPDALPSFPVDPPCRVGEVKRVTKETNVYVKINLDGSGVSDCSTGIPFLDHMLDQLSSHGLVDLCVRASGDTHIDDHHTNEDVALAIGTALLQALGERKGIYRFGNFSAPLDEAAVSVILDLSGRPHLTYDVLIPTQRVGTYDTQLVEHFFQSLVNTSGMTLHIRQLAGRNSHHIIEAIFKAFARALRQAMESDPRRQGIPSSKGVLSRT